MAIIPLYYVVASSLDVDPATLAISEGMCIAKTTLGARRATTGANDALQIIGLAGDTKSTSASSMPGVAADWQNRVSDGYNETKASGKLTVYHGGGEFATDMFVNTNMDSTKIGHYLKADTATGRLMYDAATKSFSSVAQLLEPAGYYPSGVPGTDINQDAALGGALTTGTPVTNEYIVIKLLV